MKKLVSVLLIALFAVNFLHAQTNEALTNTTIIKMVKAKLSDDLIIDEIQSSKVNFDLSDENIKTLSAANISDHVIQAMKAANSVQHPVPPAKIISQVTPPEPEKPAVTKQVNPVQPPAIPGNNTLNQPEPTGTNSPPVETPVQSSIEVAKDIINQPQPQNIEPVVKETPEPPITVKVNERVEAPSKEKIKSGTLANQLSIETTKTESGNLIVIENPAFSISGISYVKPAIELISFYNNEFGSLAGVIQEWDKKIRASQEKEKQSLDAIAKTEKDLTNKKNADAKPFSKDIIELKKNLVLSWEKHKVIKNDMVAEGKSLSEELKKISKETDNSIETKFKEVSKNVKNTDADPSTNETSNAIVIPKQKFNSKITGFFAPVTMMLVCYQNEIIALQDIIASWNEKALTSIQKDSELRSQLAPLQSELAQYLETPKQNQKLKKKEISALKKQCETIEKERKQLAKQMADDSAKLSEDLNKMKAEVQLIVKERFTDIIENIEHSYQDKFNL